MSKSKSHNEIELVSLNKSKKDMDQNSVNSKVLKDSDTEKANIKFLEDLENLIFSDISMKKFKIGKIMETGNFNAAKDVVPWYIILPNQKSKKLWDILNCVSCIFNILVCISDMGFNFECLTSINYSTILKFYYVCFVLSVIDFVFNCFTAYLDERNNYKYEIDVIITNYLIKGNMIPDILSTIPFFMLVPFDKEKECFQSFVANRKLFSFLSLLKFAKINKFFEFLERIAPKYSAFIRLAKLFSSIIFVANIIGMLLLATSPTVNGFISAVCEEFPITSKQFSICGEEMFNKFWNLYFYSLYTGIIITMGNDFKTEKSSEKYLIIISVILSTIMNASIYGNVAVTLAKVSGDVSPLLKEKIDTMKEYMNYMKFDTIFIYNIEEYHLNIWFKQRNMMYDDTVFGDMSQALQKILLLQQWKPTFFVDSKLLKIISGNFMLDMILKLKPKIFMANDIIITEGESNTEVYLNSKISLCKIYIGGQYIKSIEKGEYFGEIAIFLRSRRRTSTVLSGKDSDFLFVSGKDFEEILRNYPEDLEKIRNNAIITLMETMKFYPSNLFAKLVPNNNLKDYLFRKSIHLNDEEEDLHFNSDSRNTIDSLDFNLKINQINSLLNQVKEKVKNLGHKDEIKEEGSHEGSPEDSIIDEEQSFIEDDQNENQNEKSGLDLE